MNLIFLKLTNDVNVSKLFGKRERVGTDGGMIPPPLPSDLESAILRTAPLDEFLGAQENVKIGCERISQLITEIDHLHRSALVTVDEEDAARIGKKLEAASMLAAVESGNVRRLLKGIDEETRSMDLSETDRRLRESKQRTLCKKFMTLMEQFESMQLAYKQKYEKQIERQFLLIKPEATEQELSELRRSPQAMSQQVNFAYHYSLFILIFVDIHVGKQITSDTDLEGNEGST